MSFFTKAALPATIEADAADSFRFFVGPFRSINFKTQTECVKRLAARAPAATVDGKPLNERFPEIMGNLAPGDLTLPPPLPPVTDEIKGDVIQDKIDDVMADGPEFAAATKTKRKRKAAKAAEPAPPPVADQLWD